MSQDLVGTLLGLVIRIWLWAIKFCIKNFPAAIFVYLVFYIFEEVLHLPVPKGYWGFAVAIVTLIAGLIVQKYLIANVPFIAKIMSVLHGQQMGVTKNVRKGARVGNAAELASYLTKEGTDGLLLSRGIQEEKKKNSLPPLVLPWGRVFDHGVCVGTTGAGKTQIFAPLTDSMMSVENSVVFILDIKGDYTSMYLSGEAGSNVRLLSVPDSRSLRYSIELDRSTDAEFISNILVTPRPGDNNPYFTDAAREVLTGILLGIKATTQATAGSPAAIPWAAILAAVVDVDRIRELLQVTAKGQMALDHVKGNSGQTQGVLGMLKSSLSFLSEMAQAWPGEPDFSVRRFIREERGQRTVILRYHPSYPVISEKVLGVFLEMALAEILALDQADAERQTFFLVLDECQNLPKLRLAHYLATVREKRCSIWYTFQSSAGMKSKYQDDFNTIFEMAGTMVILRCNGETAEFVSKSLGDQEVLQTATNRSSGSTSGQNASSTESESTSNTLKQERAVLTGEIVSLPTVRTAGKVQGLLRLGGLPIVPMSWPVGLGRPRAYPEFVEAPWVREIPEAMARPTRGEDLELKRGAALAEDLGVGVDLSDEELDRYLGREAGNS